MAKPRKVKRIQEKMDLLGVTSFKHFMAYKGSLMLNDEGLVNSFSRYIITYIYNISTIH